MANLFFALILYAFAATTQKPLVIYIGGAKSTDPQMSCWAAGAKAARGTEFDFTAYPYPPCKTKDHGCQNEDPGKSLVNQIAHDVANENRPIVVVGHSSGSDLANLLATTLYHNDKHVARLIDLDGYGIPSSVPSSISADCVTADGPNQGGTAHSAYWDWAHTQCEGGHLVVKHYKGCESANPTTVKWCLHFRMANAEASPDIGPLNYDKIGYRATNPGCKPELDWLPAAARLNSNTNSDTTR